MRGIHRNEPCPCGSGDKYKFCCAVKEKSTSWITIVAVLVFSAVAVWVVAGVVRTASDPEAAAPPGKVWSDEHRHWHDAPGTANPGGPPPGPAPAGHVWDYEHGHWHEAPAAPGGAPAPAGPAPVGKVWSEEHGHWHDEAGNEPPADEPRELPAVQLPGPPEE